MRRHLYEKMFETRILGTHNSVNILSKEHVFFYWFGIIYIKKIMSNTTMKKQHVWV